METDTTDTAHAPAAADGWRALSLPNDPPHLERTVDGVLELLFSAQLLHIGWVYNGNEYTKAREIWDADMPRVAAVLRKGGIPFPCYPVEMYYQTALYCFLDSRSRHFWFDQGYSDIRDEIRDGIRWTYRTVTDMSSSSTDYLTLAERLLVAATEALRGVPNFASMEPRDIVGMVRPNCDAVLVEEGVIVLPHRMERISALTLLHRLRAVVDGEDATAHQLIKLLAQALRDDSVNWMKD